MEIIGTARSWLWKSKSRQRDKVWCNQLDLPLQVNMRKQWTGHFAAKRLAGPKGVRHKMWNPQRILYPPTADRLKKICSVLELFCSRGLRREIMSQYTVVVELDTYTQVKTFGRYFVATLFSSLYLLEWNIYLKGKCMFDNLKKQMLRTIGRRSLSANI